VPIDPHRRLSDSIQDAPLHRLAVSSPVQFADEMSRCQFCRSAMESGPLSSGSNQPQKAVPPN
jgi:hypothetical protein